MNKYRPLKVGLITNIPTPYRLPLFQLLSEQESFHLEVAFNAASERNRHWELPKQFDFNYTTLPGKTISFWGDDLISYHVNWGVADWIERKKFDALIVGGYAGSHNKEQLRSVIGERSLPFYGQVALLVSLV